MHNIILIQHLKSFQELSKYPQRLSLTQFSLFFNFRFQSFSITEFIDEIEIVWSLEHFDEFYDEGGWFYSGEVADLVGRTLLESRIFLEFLERDDFDGIFLVGQVVDAEIHFAVAALADDVTEGVVLNHLSFH